MTKLKKLQKILKRLKRVVVAYSGGADSTFLLKMAIDTLGKDNVLAVTVRSETYPRSEYVAAKRLAGRLGARHFTIKTNELSVKSFRANPEDRCYYCKKELFGTLDLLRKEHDMGYVLDGMNYDDLKDIRHGKRAAAELGVRSPLVEAKITKDEIRRFSKRLKLPTWDKPSFACLASRIPFGTSIDRNKLLVLLKGEEFIKKLGIKQVRMRIHDDIVRLEVFPEDFKIALRHRKGIVKFLKGCGYKYITLDILGYRTGSMHE